MTKREEERRRRLLRRWKIPECPCNLEKPKDTILGVLLKFASLFTIVVGILSTLFHYLFAIYAEHFYGVPSLYFSDRKLDFGLVIIYLLIPAFVLFIPVFVKRVSKEKSFNWFERLLIAFVVALLVLIESLQFSKYFYEGLSNFFIFVYKNISCINLAWIKKIVHDLVGVFPSFVFSVFSFIGCYLLLKLIYQKNADEQNEGRKSTNNYKLKTIISGFFYVPTVVLVVMMAVLLIAKVTPLDPTNQKGYEFISGKESGYCVVVEHYRDSVVLMKGSTSVEPKKGSTSVVSKRQSTKECPEKESQLTIIKGDYRIEPLGERQIEYRQFDKVGIDDKNKKK